MDLGSLERAVGEDPKNPQARLALGEALLAAGRPDDALDHLRKAMGLRRDYLEAYLALGRALLAEGEHVAAIATLEGGREMARQGGHVDWVPRFDELLAGLGPVKRKGGAPLDEAAFDELARGELTAIAKRLAALGRDVAIQHTPTVLVFHTKSRAKMGLSVQKGAREIWSSSVLGEIRFRYIPSSTHWRAAEGQELRAIVSEFLTRELGEPVSIEP
jgi:frataxin-like iron-binding protein CyaY